MALVAIVGLMLFEPPRPPAGCVDIEVLDVGQGLAVVVIGRRQVVVYDTGPWFRGGGSAARSVILPYLRGRGVERIDKLVISHADLDHAGGVDALVSNVDVREVLAGEALPRQAGPALRCVAGAGWHVDGVTFEIVHPPTITRYRGNDASCVLLVTAGSHRALLPGDIERPVEEELVRREALPAVDLVIVPHHGSRTSSGLPFVSATRPEVAIVSAGHGNRWGFPKSDIVARWHAAGADVLTTATSGSIGVRLCADGGLVSRHENRLRRRRIWHE